MPSTRVNARENAAANATILNLLAQTCADANAAVQELSVEDVAMGLASAGKECRRDPAGYRADEGAVLPCEAGGR
ncbi:hypothetical protein DVH05_015482 [Phytophthora capsici]|nr:hypothetical protein DVH05_015482 [Phytophthora capsici]